MQSSGAFPLTEIDGMSMETEITTWLESPNRGKAIVEQILVLGERNKTKRAGLWELQSEKQVGKLTIWVRSFETENRAAQVCFTRIGELVLMMHVKVSKDKMDWLREPHLLNEITSKTMHKAGEGDL